MVLSPVNKLKVFQLVFSDPGRSFYSSGEKLSGSVLLEAAQPCRVTGLRVTAAGCARVDHRGGKNRKNRSQEVEYLKYEEELRLQEQLSRDADGCFLLQPDKTYSFQFGFQLPAAGCLVSSYKGKFGYVRYYVQAELDRPSQRALQCEREFEVEEPLDVNRPDLLVLNQKLSAVRGNHIISGMCDMWQGKTIRVPKLKPSLLGCDIIKVDYALMIYLHIPGSEKLILELPLVIGTIPFSGVGSRTSSMSSWSSLPSAPPSYSNIHRDLRVDGPRTPLLLDYDGGEDDEDEGGLLMRAPELHYPPPPAYSEVDQGAASPPQVVQVF
ncbi:thioredoxin-interacting protein-like isoform X3 [Siniperca chuatsi]|uniref:thioredoxin-interacting protein-like isoform X3 n=1 Tax=Siniperca chuatsi TaxID=119488 RepID=UPI001CE0339F|nr:thioredoxin-interacting protein-like isoform X3 [Siniperca chuatsi]